MSSALLGIESVLNRFARLEKAAGDINAPSKKAGVHMLGSIAENFEAEGRPKWQALSPATLSSKTGARILVEKGDLKRAATSPESLTASDKGFAVEADDEKAEFHQFGTSKMAAREFFLFQEEDKDEIVEIFNRHLER